MVGEFNGRRFEVGSVTIEESEALDGTPLFFLYGEGPVFDSNEGKRVLITSVHKSANKAKKLCQQFNEKE